MASKTTNVEEFNRQVQAFTKDLTETQFHAFTVKIALSALNRVVLKTPVDLGPARANWQTTIGMPATGTVPWKGENSGGGVPGPAAESAANFAVSKGTKTIQAASLYPLIYLTNNLPYIEILEYGLFQPSDPGPSRDPRKGRKGRILVRGGHSVQAPNGMVMVTISELRGMFP